MSRRVVTLVERRTRRVRLPRDEADFLLTHARHVLDVIPAFERGTYRLTPRGFVGFLDGPTVRYAINPKIPWPNLRLILGLAEDVSGASVGAEGGLLAALAEEYAARLDAVTRTGLIACHGIAQSHSPFLRGKLHIARQIRDAAAGAFPDRFHIEEPNFDLNTPWHRIAKATACHLLRRELPRTLRQQIEGLTQVFATLPDSPATAADYKASLAEPRAAGYRPLLVVCRLILNGFQTADPFGSFGAAFLVDLGKAFERYLFDSLAHELAVTPGWHAEPHPTFPVGGTDLQPDILMRYHGTPAVVLDAKWKRPGAVEAADLHQILAYAAATGAPRVGLVYPGRADGCSHSHTPDGRVRVSRHRLRVVGHADELAASVAKLVRSLRRK